MQTALTTDNFNKFERLDFIDPQDKSVMVCLHREPVHREPVDDG
jgi:hypothetical protein